VPDVRWVAAEDGDDRSNVLAQVALGSVVARARENLGGRRDVVAGALVASYGCGAGVGVGHGDGTTGDQLCGRLLALRHAGDDHWRSRQDERRARARSGHGQLRQVVRQRPARVVAQTAQTAMSERARLGSDGAACGPSAYSSITIVRSLSRRLLSLPSMCVCLKTWSAKGAPCTGSDRPA
jgi:hypothetical protein